MVAILFGFLSIGLGLWIPPMSEPARLLLCQGKQKITYKDTPSLTPSRKSLNFKVYCSLPPRTVMKDIGITRFETITPGVQNEITVWYIGIMMFVYSVAGFLLFAPVKLLADRRGVRAGEIEAPGWRREP